MAIPALAAGIGLSLLDSFLGSQAQKSAANEQRALTAEEVARIAANAGVSLEEAQAQLSGVSDQFRGDILGGQEQQLQALQEGQAGSAQALEQGFGAASQAAQGGFDQARQDLLGSQQAQQGQLDQFNQLLGGFAPTAQTAQQAQLNLLGLGGSEAGAQVSQDILNSPLVAAINKQNQSQIASQAAAGGVSGGNLLSALQDANTSTILQQGLGGLQSLSGQALQGALGFGGLANQAAGGLANITGNLAGTAAQGGMAQGDIAAQLAQLQSQGLTNFGQNQAGIFGNTASQLGQGGLNLGLAEFGSILNQGNLGAFSDQTAPVANVVATQPAATTTAGTAGTGVTTPGNTAGFNPLIPAVEKAVTGGTSVAEALNSGVLSGSDLANAQNAGATPGGFSAADFAGFLG